MPTQGAIFILTDQKSWYVSDFIQARIIMSWNLLNLFSL